MTTIAYVGDRKYLCRCDCGTERIVLYSNLAPKGTTVSCGCKRKDNGRACATHGMSKTKTYKCWKSMRGRCYKPNDRNYKWYGAKGVKVCNKWRNSFENFFRDMGKCPKGHTIERKDPFGDYSPNNCEWVPKPRQARNRRDSIKITFRGKTKHILDWCDELGVSYCKAHRRFAKGLTAEQIFFPGSLHRGRTAMVRNESFKR